jgi:NAD(P)-dependent dehydrogenase (short-subunit alcohol dehydrogenase family)
MQQAKELFETNLFGVVRVTQAVLPVMREQGSGLIVYISSGLGRVVRPGIALYAATKFAGEAIAQTLRYELAPFGIDSVIVEPGAFDTGLFERSKTEMEWPEIAAEYSKFLVRGAKYGRETDVTLVSGAILEVAQTPRGKRPMRTAVGMPAVLVREYNKQHAIAQEALLTAAGTADEILTNGY